MTEVNAIHQFAAVLAVAPQASPQALVLGVDPLSKETAVKSSLLANTAIPTVLKARLGLAIKVHQFL